MATETPLRAHLQRIGISAEAFAVDHGFSPWNIRHWSRGDKMPSIGAQIEIATATGGAVTPECWLAWRLQRSTQSAAA